MKFAEYKWAQERSKKVNNPVEMVRVGYASSGNFGAGGALEYRGLKLIMPGGMHYAPAEGDHLAVLPGEEMPLCIGLLPREQESIAPGEIKLFCGGGYIHLKQNGDVDINGVTITKGGQLIPKG